MFIVTDLVSLMPYLFWSIQDEDKTLSFQNRQFQAFTLCFRCIGFVSHKVRNPEERFCNDTAHFIYSMKQQFNKEHDTKIIGLAPGTTPSKITETCEPGKELTRIYSALFLNSGEPFDVCWNYQCQWSYNHI